MQHPFGLVASREPWQAVLRWHFRGLHLRVTRFVSAL